jgi:NADH dehydrogenase
VALVWGRRFWGYPAWLLWLFVHLLYLVEFENRVIVVIQWGWSYLTRNRRARLITKTPGADYFRER